MNIFGEKLSKCRVCEKDVASTAQTCPHCGVRYPTQRQLVGIIIASCVAFVGLICIFTCIFSMFSRPNTNTNQTTNYAYDSNTGDYYEYQAPTSITLATFENCSQGMTYQECCAIIGFYGKLVSETTLMGSTIQNYSWKGNGGIGSSASMTFTDGKLTSKLQFGLK